MKQFLSLIVGAVLVLTLGACATPYVKDISEVDSVAAVEEVATPAARVVSISSVATIKGKVLFAFDSFELDLPAKVTLEKIAGEMKRYPDTLLALKGHTDKVGSNEYNQILSENRVNAAEVYLTEAGVEADRIVSAIGFGETQLLPALSDHENRRVIIMTIESK